MVQSQGERLTISGLARAGGVGVETVRYYQRRGLLQTPQREGAHGAAGVRRYDADDLRRLQFIRAAQAAGFRLDEIGELLALDASDDRVRVRELAKARIRALNEKIAELTAARDALSRLARKCSAGGAGPCPILAAFDKS